VDYPDFGVRVAKKVSQGELEKGFSSAALELGCPSWLNKFQESRAAGMANDLILPMQSESIMIANILIIVGRIGSRIAGQRDS